MYSNTPKKSVIVDFVVKSSGLESVDSSQPSLKIKQSADGKVISFSFDDVEEIIERQDDEGVHFLQVNFFSGKKILITDSLVGFKPAKCIGIEVDKLPSVVTTPDLISVVEAIEESLNSDSSHPQEVEVLKKVFDAVLEGGEAVGFDLSLERVWLKRLAQYNYKPSA